MVTTFWQSRYGTISLLKSNKKVCTLCFLLGKVLNKTINDLVDIEGSIKNPHINEALFWKEKNSQHIKKIALHDS